jgi:hypothetical protein
MDAVRYLDLPDRIDDKSCFLSVTLQIFSVTNVRVAMINISHAFTNLDISCPYKSGLVYAAAHFLKYMSVEVSHFHSILLTALTTKVMQC